MEYEIIDILLTGAILLSVAYTYVRTK